MVLKRMLRRKLKLPRNFNEYWVCATCNRPRRKNTPRGSRCHRCGCELPPLIGITRRRGERGAHSDSRYSKSMMSLAAGVRRSLGFGVNEFPPSAPTRELLGAVSVRRDAPYSENWYTQIFLDGEVYAGELPLEVCLTKIVSEVYKTMSDKKMMQIRIPPDLHKWFKLYATKNETTMTKVLINYLHTLRRREEQSVDVEQF